MKLRNSASLAAICAGLFGVAMLATPAEAQKYDKVVVFGDSLSDNGNLVIFGAEPPPPYSDGRFSNGDVWTQQLGFGELNSFGNVNGSTDFAFGGARTDNQAVPPGMQVQLADFVGLGGKFDAGTLVTVWGGANDVFQAIPGAAVSANPVGVMQLAGGTAAANIGGIVNTIATDGAGTILVPNLPTLSFTPEFLNQPAAPLADLGGNAFNATLIPTIEGVAAAHPKTNIILMDVAQAGAVIREAPGLFGFTNITTPCFNGVSVCTNPNSTFYWDGVHPTTAGHHLIAELAMEYIYYGNFGAPTGAEVETSMRQRSETMDLAVEQIDHPKFEAGEVSIGVIADHDSARTDSRAGGVIPSVGDRANSIRFVLNAPMSDSLRWGGEFSATNSDVSAGPLSFRTVTESVDGYMGWRGEGGLFLNAAGGAGFDDFRNIKRVTEVAPLINTANTSGWTAGAKVQGGMYFDMGGISLSPRVALTYNHGSVDGYTESGLMVREGIADRTADAWSAEGTVRLDAPLGRHMGAYLEAGYRDYISYNADDVTVSLPGNTALPLSTNIGRPESGEAVINAGIHGEVMDHVDLGLGYQGRHGGNNSSDMGAITLKYRF
jgi:outer membrane lipase/esterase